MSAMAVLVGWVAIGFGASIAGWIWPFRRGLSGILLNAAISILGAVGFGLGGYGLGLYALSAPLSFGFAVLGAIATNVAAHFAYLHRPQATPRGGKALGQKP